MYHAIVFLPLLGAIIAGLFGTSLFRNMGSDSAVYGGHHGHDAHGHDGHGHDAHGHDDHGHGGHYHGPMWPMYLTTGFLFIAAILSWINFWGFLHEGHDVKVEVLRWITSGTLQSSWSLRIDTLTAVMLVVVNTVSALVHLYSLGYMSHDEHQPRFFAYLSLFTFAMLMLVTSDNLIQMFFGWEGVGLASYLLIGFWYNRPSANAAAIKAFVVNRVGDFGFALGIFGVFMVYGSVEFDTVFAAAPHSRGPDHAFPLVGRGHADGALPAALHGGNGQVGAVPAAHLAAGRHGRPDAGFRPHPCRHHGDGRRLPCGAPVAAFRTRSGRP